MAGYSDADFTEALCREVTAPEHGPDFMERLQRELRCADDPDGGPSSRSRAAAAGCPSCSPRLLLPFSS